MNDRNNTNYDLIELDFLMIRVGVYMKKGKWDKMKMDAICADAIMDGMNIQLIDLMFEINQKYDLIIHKSIDLFVQCNYFNSEIARLQLENFRDYLKKNKDVIIVNSLDFDLLVTSRKKTFEKLMEIDFKGYCVVPTIEISAAKLVIKPDLACGADFAHKFQIIDRNTFVNDNNNNNNIYVQPFIETGDAVLKCYSIGGVTRYVLKNPNNININIRDDIVEKIANLIKEKLSCELFGFDLIQDIYNKKWYLIDINSFSGMEVLSDFEDLLLSFIKSKVNS